MVMRTPLAVFPCVLALSIAACTKSSADTNEPPAESGEVEDEQPGEAEGDVVGSSASVGTKLPLELVAELRLQGADADGRLVTLAPGFIATAACSDCGAPSYLWFVAVRCSDTRHCDVLTEVCEGTISRDDDTYALEFRPVEGAGDGADVCAGYTGTFEAS